MFGSLGFPEILFILVLALLVFGPKKLPEVGRTIGKALGEFRRATGDLKRSFDQEIREDASPPPRSAPRAETASPAAESPVEPSDADASSSSVDDEAE